MSRRLSFTERRRRRLAKQMDRLDRLESRTTITEPVSFTGLALAGCAAGAAWAHQSFHRQQRSQRPRAASSEGEPSPRPGETGVSPRGAISSRRSWASTPSESSAGGAGGAFDGTDHNSSREPGNAERLALVDRAPAIDRIRAAWHQSPVAPGKAQRRRAGHRAARRLKSRRARSAAHRRGAITPLQLPPSTPAASSAGGSAALLAAAASAGGTGRRSSRMPAVSPSLAPQGAPSPHP